MTSSTKSGKECATCGGDGYTFADGVCLDCEGSGKAQPAPKEDPAAKVESEMVEIGIINGIEGPCIFINNHRVAGNKPWGGGKIVREWKIDLDKIRRALTPAQLEALRAERGL